jgi:glycosyltransferase involved in cell wall biosynthesis
MVRVVFLTHTYPRWPGDFSGASLAVLARALARRGASVRVIAPGETGGSVTLDGVVVHRFPVSRSLSNLLADQDGFAARLQGAAGWSVLIRLWQALKRGARREMAAGADVVHAHWWIPAGLASPGSVPLVLTVHGADASILKRSRIGRALSRSVLRRAAVLSAVTRQAGESLQRLSGRFVGTEQIHPLPIESRGHPWTRGGDGMVMIGRLDRSRRVDLALETAAVLASWGHHLPLTIIGDGPCRSDLHRQAEQQGIGELVRFRGPMPEDQARSHLARADVMLLTAQGETSLVTALEAFVAGVPVVACWDGGALVDVVPESGAGRLSLPSAEALAHSVLSVRADRDRLAIGRLVGEAWRARLAPDNVAQVCEGWYRAALAG